MYSLRDFLSPYTPTPPLFTDDDLHEYSKITNGGVVVDGERNVNAARWDFLFYPAKHSVK
jgi:hypothetical protein